MKLAEEHQKWMRESIPTEGTSSAEKSHWISGVKEAIEKFGGIQWNKYPDSNPEEGQYVDIITKWRRRLTDCEVEKDGFYDREGGVFYEHSHVTHWAYINLPNQ